MHLHLQRDIFGESFTLGVLTVDGKSFGFTVEDTDRRLHQNMSLEEIRQLKVSGRTCIPTGRYRVLRTWSPKFRKEMLLVADVPGFRGIRVHPGNSHEDTAGCILPGLERDAGKGVVFKSRAAWEWLDREVEKVLDRGEVVWLTVESGQP